MDENIKTDDVEEKEEKLDHHEEGHHHHHHHSHRRHKKSKKRKLLRFIKRRYREIYMVALTVLFVVFVVLVAVDKNGVFDIGNGAEQPGTASDSAPSDEAVVKPAYSFAALADVHYQYETAAEDYKRALKYLNGKVDFVCVAGDLVSFASEENMQAYKACVDKYAGAMMVYECAGNHDTYPALGVADNIDTKLWEKYTGDKLYYSFTYGNDVFIMFGMLSEKADGLFSDKALEWLEQTLEANKNKRCFVFQHVPEQSDLAADPSASYSDLLSGKAGQSFVSLIKKYPNTVWFHGHTHTTLGVKQNPLSHLDYRSVHIPSLAQPRFFNVEKAELEDYYYDGYGNQIWGSTLAEGYIVDVYPNKIVIRGINFAAGENGDKVEVFKDEIYALDTSLKIIED